ncbi:uncharacterized protein TNCV_4810601 [Trichonephila clavipes]|nr:uncharacterized protein TNCV_4810601 [Trichonephila clavipes]
MRISHKRLTIWKTTLASIADIRKQMLEKVIENWTSRLDYIRASRGTNTFKKEFLCLDNEHIFGGDQGYTLEIIDEILTTARDLELEVNEDDIEELIMGHENELTTKELQEILNEEHQETQRNVSPSERGPMPTSAIKDLFKKWDAVKAMVLEWHPNQTDVSRVEDLYNNNAMNYFWKILKKREKQSTLNMFFNAP